MWSLYVHYVYLLIYYLSVIRSFIFFNIKYGYNITLNYNVKDILMIDEHIFGLDVTWYKRVIVYKFIKSYFKPTKFKMIPSVLTNTSVLV